MIFYNDLNGLRKTADSDRVPIIPTVKVVYEKNNTILFIDLRIMSQWYRHIRYGLKMLCARVR